MQRYAKVLFCANKNAKNHSFVQFNVPCSPIIKMGFGRDLVGICKGIAWDLQGNYVHFVFLYLLNNVSLTKIINACAFL